MRSFEFKNQGETFTTLKTAADTNGERVEMTFMLAPAASEPLAHIHTQQVEWFEVVSGKMIATVNKQEHTVRAGQKIEVKAGQTHTFRNGSNGSGLELRIGYEPALHIEWFLTEMAKVAMRQPQKPLVNRRTFSR